MVFDNPVDIRPGGQTYRTAAGYFSITLPPNLGDGGNVLLNFWDEQALAALPKKLLQTNTSRSCISKPG
jgi:hypothetical protein